MCHAVQCAVQCTVQCAHSSEQLAEEPRASQELGRLTDQVDRSHKADESQDVLPAFCGSACARVPAARVADVSGDSQPHHFGQNYLQNYANLRCCPLKSASRGREDVGGAEP